MLMYSVTILLDKQQTMQTSWNSTISCENSFLQILPWVLSSKASEASTLAFSLLSASNHHAEMHQSLTFFMKRSRESKGSSS